MQKLLEELHIVTSKKFLPTIEINTNSIEGTDYLDVLEESLADFAELNPDECISVYSHAESCVWDFGQPVGGAFLIIARSKKLFNYLWQALKEVDGLEIRLGEYLPPRLDELVYQVEGGYAWRREDLLNFIALNQPEVYQDEGEELEEATDLEEDEKEEVEEDWDDSGEPENVGELLRTAASDFNLPHGSIIAINPDGSKISPLASVDTLRLRWQEGYCRPAKKRAWEQGGLDGLCGLYSCVNAMHSCIGNLDEEDCQKLFQIGVDYLDRRRMLRKAMTEGLNWPYILHICNRFRPLLESWGLALEARWLTKDRKYINTVLSSMNEWISAPSHCVIVAINGRYNHWTCIAETFGQQIGFVDSDGLAAIRVKDFTSGTTVNKPYIIRPKKVLAIGVTSIT